jgi:hypothetical protein
MFLAVFIPALLGGIATVLASMVGRVLVALSIGFVTYKSAGIGIDAIFTLVKQTVGGAPADVVALLGYLWVDKAISTMFSAFTAAMLIKGLAGSVTKMVTRR